MPKDNIERAIKKGEGNDPDSNYEEVRYEGYGPDGVAIIVEALTNNKNRTAAEVRSTLVNMVVTLVRQVVLVLVLKD